MKRVLFSVAALVVILSSTGCLCNPCRGPIFAGHGMHGGGVVYEDGGCDSCMDGGNCGMVTGCGLMPGGYGVTYGPPCYPIATNCTRSLLNAAHSVGQLAVGVVTLPIGMVGSIFNWGACGVYPGCGCGSEVYYGDNYIGGGCDPCATGCGNGYQPGCAHCSGGYTEGIAPQIEEAAPQVLPSKDVRNMQQVRNQPLQARQMPARSVNQQVVYRR